MPDNDVEPEPDSAEREPELAEAVTSTASYETDEGVVFYDVDRPLAWIQAEETVTIAEAR
jgi:hypothetical protein